MNKIDALDKRIMGYIEQNARATDRELATLIRKSKDSAKYRIQKLQKMGIITGFGCLVDYTKLGFTSYKLYLRVDASPEQYQELVNWGKSKKESFCVFESQTSWHICFALFVKDILAYEKIEKEMLVKFGHIIRKITLCHMTRAVLYSNPMLTNEQKKGERIWGQIETNTLDEADERILSELLIDGAQTYINIAKKTQLSIDVVIRKIRALKEKKIISFFPTNINYTKLDSEIYKAFIKTKQLSDEAERKLVAHLESLTQTRNIVFTVGPWKLEVEFIIKNHEELYTIIQTLKKEFTQYISDVEYTLFRNEVFYPAGLLTQSKNIKN